MTIKIGWKSIRPLFDNLHERTLRKWADKLGLPIKWIDGTPTITEAAAEEWWDNLPEVVKSQLSEELKADKQATSA